MKELEGYIESYFGIGGEALSPISDLFDEVELKKNEYLLKINQYSNSLGFIKEGYIRIYAWDEGGNKEVTQWISSRGMFILDISGVLFNTPSRWNIQALTDCQLIR